MSEYPRITYQTSGRTFDRLFKEQSLDETKDVVRKKLGLGHDAPIELAQLRDGRRIDLEDDDDFEAFKALTKTSLHATVAVTIPEKGRSSSSRAHASGKRKSRPNGPEHGVPESAHSDTESSTVQAPDTPPPRKKRRVKFDGDLATSVASQPSQRSASKRTRSPSREVALTSVHNSIPGAVAKQATSGPSSEAEIARPSTQVPTETPRKHKRDVTKVAPPEDDTDLAEDHAHASRKKKIKGTPSRKESLPKPGVLNADDPSSDTRKTRVHKGQTEIPVEDNPIPTGIHTVLPSIGDESLQASIEVFNPDKPKKTKTGKRKSVSADAKGSVKKSKTGSADPAEGGMSGQSQPNLTEFPEPTKSLQKKASKKKVEPEVSRAGNDDDIDKTIAAFLTKRQQAHPRNLSLVSTSEIAVRVDDPPPKTTRKSKEVKPSARITHVSSAASVEAVGTNVPERSTRKANQTTLIHNGPSASLNPVELNESIAAVAIEEAATNSRSSTSEHDHTSVEPPGSEPGSKLGSANSIHPLAGSAIAQERPDSIEVHTAQMEKDPGFAPSSEAVVHRQFAEKARSTLPDSNNDSDTGSSPMSAFATTPASFSKEGSIAEVTPTIPKGLELSEVPIEAHGEGSSSDSSTESEDEWNELAGVVASLNASLGPVDLEDQLTALIHGPAKHGPRKSALDEIPSSSEAGGESSSEALILDEEEDMSKQPSYKRMRALSKIRSSSIEPEDTSEDEEDASVPIYMDTSHEVPDQPQKLSAVSGGTGHHVSIKAGAEASERPEVDTYLAQPLEAQDQDQSIAPQTVPVDATAPSSQSGMKLLGLASPELDATAINTEPSKSPAQAYSDPQASKVLVPASSPTIDGSAASTKKVQSQDTNDEVESAVEPHGSDEESDPIEQGSTQPNQPASSQSIGSAPRDFRRCTTSNAPVLEQPSRRSDRLANRRSCVATSEAALVPLSQIRGKMTSALEKTLSSAKDSDWIRDVAEEATREKRVQKRVGKSKNKPTRSTAQQSDESGDETSPSVAREDGSPRAPLPSQAKWTTLPTSDQTQLDASSVIDELQTSSQASLGKFPPGEDESSRSDDEKTVPLPTQGAVTVPSRVYKGDAQPLFFPGSSQIPRAPSASPSESENEPKMVLPKKTPIRTPRSGSQLRRLTVLASSGTLFSKSKGAQRRFKNTPSVVPQPRFDASDDGEDDEESSSSSDDAVSSSHIPEERRAGAARREKGQGLSSLIRSSLSR